MITMLLGGLWHGASWVFVFWGFLHGFYLIVQRLLMDARSNTKETFKIPSWLSSGLSILIVYLLTCLAWIFFRSPDFSTATEIIQRILTFQDFAWVNVTNKFMVLKGFALIFF